MRPCWDGGKHLSALFTSHGYSCQSHLIHQTIKKLTWRSDKSCFLSVLLFLRLHLAVFMLLTFYESRSVTHSVMSNSSHHHGLQPARLLCTRDSPGKNTGVGCHSLLQGSSQPEITPRSPALQTDSLQSELPGRPLLLLIIKITYLLVKHCVK